jgi:hypothetical protein|tara:strand:+ start:188 stop:760 length:573 start_codon:yes stop_codon:yes gene_type:complete
MSWFEDAYQKANLRFDHEKIVFYESIRGRYWEVMMDWEKPIMDKIAELSVKEGDHVLECGFGMGILSDAIQARKPASHTICENHKDIIPRLRSWAKNKSNVILHEDKWINVKDSEYSVILIDTYADDDLPKFKQFCEAKMNKGIISWWNHLGSEEHTMGWDNVKFYDVTVDPPKNAYYNNSIYKIPIKEL